ncbi:UDP-glucose 4-epimerase [Hortaea werneckii]|nr:UDP-glucose 4-epimerase [Hortaea werneckii]
MPGISSCNPALASAGLDFRQETAFRDHEFESLPPDDGKSYIMVLGGLGYIGSHTVLELLQEGFNVVVVDDLSNSFKNVLTRITTLAQAHCRLTGLIMPALRFHKMDYRSRAMNDMLARYSASRSRISAVIHFAAFKSVSESIAQPLAYYRNNVCGLVELLATLQQHGIRNFVFSSSATVYGAKANGGEPLHEEDLVHMDEVQTDVDGAEILRLNGTNGLTSPYGRSKYFSEAILADLARADPSMRITALRYFNPVGCHPSGILREDPRQIPTNLFPVVASVMQGKKDTLEIFGTDWNTRDGTAIRDFIHVVDLARGHVAALTAAASDVKREPFRAYNLGTGKGMTVAEVLASFEEASKQQIPAVRAPRRAGDVGSCVAVVERAECELKWRAVKSVGDCARDCWNALKLPDGIEY